MLDHGRLGPIEWAAASRPRPGEQVCGDRSIAVGIGTDCALFGVVDGLGHGPAAASAATAAVEALNDAPGERVELLVERCHRVLANTRGAAMTVARVDFAQGVLTWTGVGNVSADLVARTATGIQVLRSSARLAAGIVGYRIPEIAPVQPVSIRTGDLLVISSDGITEDHLDHIDFAAQATVIAERILGKHAKETDDAMVLAARHRGAWT